MDSARPNIVTAAILFALVGAIHPVAAQDSKPAQSGGTAGTESTYKIRSERNLVVVRVVVRDSSGKAVKGLGKDDFRLFDNGKPQSIADFSVESHEAVVNPPTGGSAAKALPATPAEAVHPVAIAERFVALFFDDLHVSFEDLVHTRDAAGRYLSSNLQPSDRVAIFTTSGFSQLEFTADRAVLHDALLKIRQRPMPAAEGSCPTISEYQAYKIVDQHDPTALQIAESDAIVECCAGPPSTPGLPAGGGGGPNSCPQATPEYIENTSRGILNRLEASSEYTFHALVSLCRRMAALPGQRSVIFLSPGFFSNTETDLLQQVIDRALSAGVVINTLDARGLYVDIAGGDASQRTTGNMMFAPFKSQIYTEARIANEGVLVSLASGTGGVYYHDSNDYDAGFRRTGGFPEAGYVLTFSPENLKDDGTFHRLKVTLANPSKFTLQARLGYYAPRKATDAAAQADGEIQEALFSRDEMRGIPVDVHTRFFKKDTLNAKIVVVAHVDMNSIQFQKDKDRHRDNMTLVAGLFDTNGKYITGSQAKYELNLTDATFDKLTRTGVSFTTDLDAQAGTYSVRVIVRDLESGLMAALNETLEIPY